MRKTARVRFARAIDRFLDDMRTTGRITSKGSERAYTDVLRWHEQDSETPDPCKTTREDVRRTLRRWTGNTQATRHSILAAFYRWLVREGYRKDSPADQLPRTRKRKADVPRLRQDEALALTMACETARERRVIYLGLFAGLRSQELRGLQGRHFEREGLVWISKDIAKGGRPRWLPVLSELQPVVDEIRVDVARGAYVIPAQRRNPQAGEWYDLPDQKCSSQAIGRLVKRVADRAGVVATPHTLRRAFADLVERQAGVRVAQKLLGHSTLATTEGYLSEPTLDELQGAVSDIALSSSRRSKASTWPSSRYKRTSSPSTSTSTGSVSISPTSGSTPAKTRVSIGTPPRGFEPRFPP
jgi:integrase/recombinase XerD